jgi:hypothetical protein
MSLKGFCQIRGKMVFPRFESRINGIVVAREFITGGLPGE